jgi:hypothetical protein
MGFADLLFFLRINRDSVFKNSLVFVNGIGCFLGGKNILLNSI